MALLRSLRSVVAFVAMMVWFIFPNALILYGIVVPLAWVAPSKRHWAVSRFMKFIVGGLFFFLRLGGARFTRKGRVPTEEPCYVVMNHQSQIDILTATLIGDPYVPAFVTRARYSRFVPLVSTCIRLLDCPIVDPQRDPRGALEAMREAAPRMRHGVLVFPEGHRSRDGEVLPFRARGLSGMLAAKPLPVYVIASDGLWRARRLVDFVLNIHTLRGDAEVLGPYQPPENEDEIDAFIGGLRESLTLRLVEMRGRRAA